MTSLTEVAQQYLSKVSAYYNAPSMGPWDLAHEEPTMESKLLEEAARESGYSIGDIDNAAFDLMYEEAMQGIGMDREEFHRE